MCTVEVALIADVLRLSNGQQRVRSPGAPPRSICRRLFTDDSGGESPAACVRRLEAEIEHQVRQRWNFDFRNGTPLPGRYQWVPSQSGAAALPKVAAELPLQTTAALTENSENVQTTLLPRRTKNKSQTTVTQSKITDFLHQRKRHRTLDSDLPCSKPLKARRVTEQQTSPSVVTID